MLKILAKLNNVLIRIGLNRSYLIGFLAIFIIGLIFGYFVETVYVYNLSGNAKNFWQIFSPV